MNFYQEVVVEYLRADRSLFLNTQCCIQLNEGDNPDTSGPHWYCDALACDFRDRAIFLCEISYSTSLTALMKRLTAWNENWQLLNKAIQRDCHLSDAWPVRPWLFVPTSCLVSLLSWLEKVNGSGKPLSFTPRITPLERVQPWRYRSWNRVGEARKPKIIPKEMQE